MLSRTSSLSKLRPIQSAPSKRKGSLILRRWPSSDFSIGISIPPKADGADHPLDGIYRDATSIAFPGRQGEDNAERLSLNQWGSLLSYFEGIGRDDLALNAVANINRVVADASTMGLSVVSNSHNSAPQRKITRRGRRGITTYQKRLIKSAGVILESEASRQNLTFYTTTLPPLDLSDLEKITSNWAELVRRFVQELGRELKRRGLPGEVVGVTEVQEKRFDRTGQIYPHLHLVFQGRRHRLASWAITPAVATELWCHQVELLLGKSIYRKATTQVESVKKSLKKELGKYLSKGSKIVRQALENGKADSLPACWAICTLSLRRRVKRQIVEIRHIGVTWLFDRRQDLQALGLMRFKDISFEVKSDTGHILREQVIGCAGFLSLDNWQELIMQTPEQLDSYINLKLGQALLSELDSAVVALP